MGQLTYTEKISIKLERFKQFVNTNYNSAHATIQDGQAPGDPTVLKRFFHDNFVIFRRRSKRIAFLESENFSTRVCIQIFNFRDGHVTIFRHPSGAYISQMPGHRLSRLAKGTPSESRLSTGTIDLG